MFVSCFFVVSPMLILDSFLRLLELRQGREIVVILGDVSIIDCAIVLCHFQSRMPQQSLKCESVAPAAHQILSSKGVPKKMRACLCNASALIIASDALTQSAIGELFSAFVAEQKIGIAAAANLLILPQNHCHLPTQRNRLHFLVFIVARNDLPLLQIHIAISDSTHCGSSTA